MSVIPITRPLRDMEDGEKQILLRSRLEKIGDVIEERVAFRRSFSRFPFVLKN
jgi:hypothetical protein